MSTISATQSIVINNTQYSVDGGAFTNLGAYPWTIRNTGSGTINIKFQSGITYTDPNQYFNIGDSTYGSSSTYSNNMTFDGQNNVITVNATGYPGLFNNARPISYGGAVGINGNNIVIQNFIVNGTNGTLANNGGWICAAYFSSSQSYGASVINCSSRGPIGGSGAVCGGIVGGYCGIAGTTYETVYTGTVYLYIYNCYSTGLINNYSGGIIGANSGGGGGATTGGILIKKCYSTGDINNACGMCGSQTKNVIMDNCYTTGNTTYSYTSGSSFIGPYSSNFQIINSYTTNTSNSIAYYIDPTSSIINCYSLYTPIINGSSDGQVTNCYAANGTWIDASANAALDYTTVPIGLSNQGTVWTRILPNSPYILTSFYKYPCFKEGTKILTINGYVEVENLKNGDLIKTSLDGFKPIVLIGKRNIVHMANLVHRIKDQLYICQQNQFPELFEDLVLTGCHSILVDNFADDQEREAAIAVNGDLYITDDKYRLPACVDMRTNVYGVAGTYTIYHFALENDNYYWNYGVYANGLLVETSSKRYMKELSNMELI